MRLVLVLSILLSMNLYGNKYNVKTYIPIRAKQNMNTLCKVVNNVMYKDDRLNGHVPIYYFPALIEHESCVQLGGTGYWARRCWSPISKLQTYWDKDKTIPREEGVGLFQLTRAWRKNGTLRLDIIRDLKRRYPKQLRNLNWGDVSKRPDLQMKAGLLLWRSNFNKLNNHINNYNKMLMADSVYNGGFRYFRKERKLCGLTKNCNPDIWFNNVAKMNARGNRILYGKRTAYMINRHHVRNVLLRMPKYKKYLDSISERTDINNTKHYIKK